LRDAAPGSPSHVTPGKERAKVPFLATLAEGVGRVSIGERDKDAVAPAFVGLMTHELAQPLAVALGSTYTLKERSVEELDEVTRELLCDTAIRNLEQLQSLLDNLRVFTDAEAGILMVETRPEWIEDLFRDAENDFGALWPRARISFVGEPGLQVNVDVTLFRQVLFNLINNAVKFSPKGSSICVEAFKGRDDEVLITVTDEGEGFPPDQAERIFERSVRLQAGVKGMGVGLFVARTIVEAHGGRIWAENRNPGARFSVAIPSE
jgi:two-component system, OmpR family, sensor histidine kinase KdpD